MMDSLEDYLKNIAPAATQTADLCGPLAELAASLAVSVETVARQQQEIKRLTAQLQSFTKRGPKDTKDKEQYSYFSKIVKRSGEQHRMERNVSSTPTR